MTMEIVIDEAQDLEAEAAAKQAIVDAAVKKLRELIPADASALLLTKPSCVQCTATYRDFGAKGVEHDSLDLTEDPDLLDTVKKAGYLSAPVVITREDHWAGFRPDKIDELVARLAA